MKDEFICCKECGNKTQHCVCEKPRVSGSAPAAGWVSDFDSELALVLSKIVHDRCDNVPHDIGIILAVEVEKTKKPNVTGEPSRQKA